VSTKRSRPKAAKVSTGNQRSNHNSLAAQRQRMLRALRAGPVSTIRARRNLDILHPAGRVRELRLIGHNIRTIWTREQTDCGKHHRVGLYVLARRK